MRRTHLLLLALVLVAGLAVGGVLLVRRDADASTPVRADRAAAIAGAPEQASDVEPGLRPAAGTYEYRGTGREDLSLLGGSTHEFPDRVFAVVSLDEDDDCAWRADLVFVEEHVERRDSCTAAAGTTDQSIERTTNFLGHEQTSTYDCDGAGARLATGARAGSSTTWTCSEARGAKVVYTATVVDRPTIEVGGEPLAVTHLRLVGRQRNKGKGDETTELWLLDSGLPARMKSVRTNDSSAGPLGTMHLRERYDYTLASAAPAPT